MSSDSYNDPAPGRLLRSERLWTNVLAGCLGFGVVVILNFAPPIQFKSKPQNDSGKEIVRLDVSRLLVDRVHYEEADGGVVSERNWLTVQALMWVASLVGLGELWTRRKAWKADGLLQSQGLLPEDEHTLLTSEDLKSIYRRARGASSSGALSTMIKRMVMEFRKSQSVTRVNNLLDSSLELYQHKLDLQYTLLRYIVWLIPTLGFLGTVMGIAAAMGFAGSGAVALDNLLEPTTQKLAVAFYTTWLGLMFSAVLVLGMSVMQAAEEKILNDNGNYCLDNLVIRLLEPTYIKDPGRPSA